MVLTWRPTRSKTFAAVAPGASLDGDTGWISSMPWEATRFLFSQKCLAADFKIRSIIPVQRRHADAYWMVLDQALWEFSLMEMLAIRSTRLKSQRLTLHRINTHRPIISYYELYIFSFPLLGLFLISSHCLSAGLSLCFGGVHTQVMFQQEI